MSSEETQSRSSLSAEQATSARSEYTPRAQVYDDSNKGWHIRLGEQFATWVEPRRGDRVLDLACGTGLVTFPMARHVGVDGVVIGVDVTTAMLDVARAKLASVCAGRDYDDGENNGDGDGISDAIEFHEADITDEKALLAIEPVRQTLQQRGGFDIISCCSALILLPDPVAAVKLWASLLNRNGKLIIDVPTEHQTLQYLATEILGGEVGIGFPFSRAWVTGPESLGGVMRDAGLEVDRSWRTESCLDVRLFELGHGMEVFEREVVGKYVVYEERGMVDEARMVWPRLWEGALWDDGRFHDGHWLYITIGRKL